MEFNNIRYCKKIAKIDNINTIEMQKLQIFFNFGPNVKRWITIFL